MDSKSKHPFGKWLDTEQTFVVAWRHDEHSFDVGRPGHDVGLQRAGTGTCGSAGGPVMAAALSFPSIRSRQGLKTSHGGPSLGVVRGGRWDPQVEADPELIEFEAPRLVILPDHRTRQPLVPVIRRHHRRRASPAVRRRRGLLAITALLVVGLALPLGGSGGRSHPTGPALAETGHPVVYTVQPGDTLWSIAQRVNPSADPRPLVSQIEGQTGSATVTPGQHIKLP
jgi:hypothetical protein